MSLQLNPGSDEPARSNALNFAGQLPFQQTCQRFAGGNLKLLGHLIYCEFNNFTAFALPASGSRDGVGHPELLQDIDRRLYELCPIPQQCVCAPVHAANNAAGHRHDVAALIGGGLLLFDTDSDQIAVSPAFVIAAGAVLGLATVLVGDRVLGPRRRPGIESEPEGAA